MADNEKVDTAQESKCAQLVETVVSEHQERPALAKEVLLILAGTSSWAIPVDRSVLKLIDLRKSRAQEGQDDPINLLASACLFKAGMIAKVGGEKHTLAGEDVNTIFLTQTLANLLRDTAVLLSGSITVVPESVWSALLKLYVKGAQAESLADGKLEFLKHTEEILKGVKNLAFNTKQNVLGNIGTLIRLGYRPNWEDREALLKLAGRSDKQVNLDALRALNHIPEGCWDREPSSQAQSYLDRCLSVTWGQGDPDNKIFENAFRLLEKMGRFGRTHESRAISRLHDHPVYAYRALAAMKLSSAGGLRSFLKDALGRGHFPNPSPQMWFYLTAAFSLPGLGRQGVPEIKKLVSGFISVQRQTHVRCNHIDWRDGIENLMEILPEEMRTPLTTPDDRLVAIGARYVSNLLQIVGPEDTEYLWDLLLAAIEGWDGIHQCKSCRPRGDEREMEAFNAYRVCFRAITTIFHDNLSAQKMRDDLTRLAHLDRKPALAGAAAASCYSIAAPDELPKVMDTLLDGGIPDVAWVTVLVMHSKPTLLWARIDPLVEACHRDAVLARRVRSHELPALESEHNKRAWQILHMACWAACDNSQDRSVPDNVLRLCKMSA